MKKILILVIAIVIIIILGIGGYFLFQSSSNNYPVNEDAAMQKDAGIEKNDESMEKEVDKTKTVLGQSVEGRNIIAYHYGDNSPEKEVLLIGGIHGGYSWNTVLVAYESMEYFQANPSAIPDGIRVSVIPVLNPDGLYKIVGTTDKFTSANVPAGTDATIPGRFNANNVDLNRNFDCDWMPVGKWQNKDVSGGSSAFSEPESLAVKNYIENNKPDAVVVWYSSAGGVFSSNCNNGVSPETTNLTNIFAKASGYPAHKEFNYYEIAGDMTNWLAKIQIPAISVLLTNHTDTEWGKNKAGIDAAIKYLAE